MKDGESQVSQGVGLEAFPEASSLDIVGWSRESAQSVLRMRFGANDCERMIQLESKSAQTSLTEAEEIELASYEQIAVFLEYLKRSAREYLQMDGDSPEENRGNAPALFSGRSSFTLRDPLAD